MRTLGHKEVVGGWSGGIERTCRSERRSAKLSVDGGLACKMCDCRFVLDAQLSPSVISPLGNSTTTWIGVGVVACGVCWDWGWGWG